LGYYYPGSYLILQRRIRSAFTSQINSSQFIPQKKIFNEIPYNKIFLLSNKKDEKYPNFNIIEKNSMPDCLEITSWTDMDEIMGVAHKKYFIQGIQFHPESILTRPGKKLLKNFLDMTEKFWLSKKSLGHR